MENIKLNIEKSLEFISKDVLASYAQKVNECMEQDLATISWDGCTCPLLLLKNI